jgi:hypothetical protein
MAFNRSISQLLPVNCINDQIWDDEKVFSVCSNGVIWELLEFLRNTDESYPLWKGMNSVPSYEHSWKLSQKVGVLAWTE